MVKKISQFSVIYVLLAIASVAQAKVAQIISLNGEAVVERDGHKYIAQRGMILEEGDIVRALKDGQVGLKYESCDSDVESTKEVVISKSAPCTPATLAKAADLKAPTTKAYKIQRIDPNLAEAQCTACKVELASGTGALLSGSSWGPLAGAAGVAAAAKSSGGGSNSNVSVSPP